MSYVGLAVNFFVALFALIDPIGMVPLFAAATPGATPPARRRIALYISTLAFAFLLFFYFTGVALLKYFGISIDAFRIAGGILLFRLGLVMMGDEFTTKFEDAAEEGETLSTSESARKHFERLIVPFGMPLLIGPGAISAVIIYASANAEAGWPGTAAGVAAIFAVSVMVLIAFLSAGLITRALGRIGMTVVVRVLGLILCALAVQFIIVGVSGATAGIIRGSVAHPYPAHSK
jgi:multiple antibiotic resistance protein